MPNLETQKSTDSGALFLGVDNGSLQAENNGSNHIKVTVLSPEQTAKDGKANHQVAAEAREHIKSPDPNRPQSWEQHDIDVLREVIEKRSGTEITDNDSFLRPQHKDSDTGTTDGDSSFGLQYKDSDIETTDDDGSSYFERETWRSVSSEEYDTDSLGEQISLTEQLSTHFQQERETLQESLRVLYKSAQTFEKGSPELEAATSDIEHLNELVEENDLKEILSKQPPGSNTKKNTDLIRSQIQAVKKLIELPPGVSLVESGFAKALPETLPADWFRIIIKQYGAKVEISGDLFKKDTIPKEELLSFLESSRLLITAGWDNEDKIVISEHSIEQEGGKPNNGLVGGSDPMQDGVATRIPTQLKITLGPEKRKFLESQIVKDLHEGSSQVEASAYFNKKLKTTENKEEKDAIDRFSQEYELMSPKEKKAFLSTISSSMDWERVGTIQVGKTDLSRKLKGTSPLHSLFLFREALKDLVGAKLSWNQTQHLMKLCNKENRIGGVASGSNIESSIGLQTGGDGALKESIKMTLGTNQNILIENQMKGIDASVLSSIRIPTSDAEIFPRNLEAKGLVTDLKRHSVMSYDLESQNIEFIESSASYEMRPPLLGSLNEGDTKCYLEIADNKEGLVRSYQREAEITNGPDTTEITILGEPQSLKEQGFFTDPETFYPDGSIPGGVVLSSGERERKALEENLKKQLNTSSAAEETLLSEEWNRITLTVNGNPLNLENDLTANQKRWKEAQEGVLKNSTPGQRISLLKLLGQQARTQLIPDNVGGGGIAFIPGQSLPGSPQKPIIDITISSEIPLNIGITYRSSASYLKQIAVPKRDNPSSNNLDEKTIYHLDAIPDAKGHMDFIEPNNPEHQEKLFVTEAVGRWSMRFGTGVSSGAGGGESKGEEPLISCDAVTQIYYKKEGDSSS